MKRASNLEDLSLVTSAERPRILVVDDDPGARRTLSLILERKGFDVLKAGTMQKALEEADNGSLNIGLLDVRLPDGKGTELLSPLKERHPDVELIMITGYASTETAVRALNEGATAYITKPLNIEAVLAEIEKILDRQRLIAERREALRRQHESEKRYRDLFEGVPVALYRTTPSGRIVDVNPALVDLLGYPDRETLLKTDVKDGFLDEAVRAQWQSLMEEHGVVRRFEARFRRYDGETIWVLDSARAVRDDAGRIVYYEGSLEDVTERKKAQRALQERVKELTCLYAVQQEVQRLALSPSQLCERIIGHIIPAMRFPEFAVPVIDLEGEHFAAPGFNEDLPDGLEAEISVGGEDVGRVAVRYLEEKPFLIPSEADLLSSIAESLVLWLQRRRARAALRESEARYRTLFNSASDAILIHDMEGSFLEVNDVAVERLKYSREELLQLGPQDVEAKEYAARFDARMEELRRRGHVYLETVHNRRDGTTVPTELSARLIHYDDGEAVLAIARDVTEREGLQRRLRRQERLATLGRLVGGVAHDTNNALMSIILGAELLEQSPFLPDELTDDVKMILHEADEASNVMQQVLDFSRQSPLETRPIDLKSLVEETLHVLGRVMPESIDILWKASADDYVLEADPARIHQVVMNLALNARDAMPKGGELQITLSQLTWGENEKRPVAGMEAGTWISLTVADTGTGISDRALEHLFEPFFTTKAQGEGTGLGLAQVYGIVEQHGGYISVDTERGRGTQFDIYLPAHEGPLPAERTSRTPESMPRGAGETVLVVEDEDGVREACSKALRALGYRTLLVRDGRQALQTIQNGAKVDLVLTDVVMPNMDGLDLMQKLKSVAPSLPIVVMTGYVLDDRIAGIRQNEYVPFLHKPIDRKSLAEIVHIGLRLRREDSE